MIELFKDIAKATGMTIIILLIAAGMLITALSLFKYAFGPSPEQESVMRVPQLMSEADGCKVYRFVDNGTHYFTRCGEQVNTIRNYTENCGKACTRNRTETITTEGNK